MGNSSDREIPIMGVAIALVCILAALFLPTNLFEHLDAQHCMVIQAPMTGTLTVHTSPGIKWQGFGTVTKYAKREQFWFSDKADQGKPDEESIKVRFNDGGHGNISGSVAWEIPTDPGRLLLLHSKYGTENNVEQQLVRTVVEKSVYMTGPLMSSKESYAERRNDLISFMEDQIQNGVYRTVTEQVKEADQMTGQPKTVNVVKLVKDDKGLPQRQEASPLTEFGVRVFNLSLNAVTYDDTVEKQIQEQQKVTMQVQTAIANSKRAEQDAITAEKNGEAEAAKAKWTQEAIKAQKVTEAEQMLAVATLNRQVQEQDKQSLILQGEGEATRRRLIMQADGALERKLDIWLESQKVWAQAFANYKGAVVPSIVTGGREGASSNAAMDFMSILGIKAAKDLSVDVNPAKQ